MSFKIRQTNSGTVSLVKTAKKLYIQKIEFKKKKIVVEFGRLAVQTVLRKLLCDQLFFITARKCILHI